MAATAQRPSTRKGAGAAVLPPVSVFKFQEAQYLLEQLVDEHTDTFVAAGQAYRDRHREGTRRPLDATEIAAIAAGLGVSLQQADEQITEAGLTHHDEPQPQELLLAAGVATFPAFMSGALRFVALLEMPDDDVEHHAEAGTLPEELERRAQALRRLDLKEARTRANAALEHLAAAAGVTPGKARALLTGPVMQALWQAMTHLTSPSASASSTSSPASTAGAVAQSSTAPPGGTPGA